MITDGNSVSYTERNQYNQSNMWVNLKKKTKYTKRIFNFFKKENDCLTIILLCHGFYNMHKVKHMRIYKK